MHCVGLEDPLCEKFRDGDIQDVQDVCSAMKNASWACDDSWGTKCIGAHPGGAEYNSVTVREGGLCPEWCPGGSGARGAVFALSRYIHQAGTCIFAERVKYYSVQYC